MSIPDSGSSPQRRGPAPRKPVRPSIRPFSLAPLDKPFQPFELEILERMTASDRDFRIFCMFGRPVCAALAGCERPIVIQGRIYDSVTLRTLYLGTAVEAMLTQASGEHPLQPPRTTTDATSTPVDPASSMPTQAVIRQLLRPLLHDTLLMELGTRPASSPQLAHIGTMLATLCFEHFSRCPDPVQVVRDLAEELCLQGLLFAPRETLIEVGEAPLFPLDWRATPKGKTRLAEHLMPRWECARVRRPRAPG